jgi:hypothetical protein
MEKYLQIKGSRTQVKRQPLVCKRACSILKWEENVGEERADRN